MAGQLDPTFLVLVNSRSGGQDGPQLLEKFRALCPDHGEGGRSAEGKLNGTVVSLTEPLPSPAKGVVGPRPGLEKYRDIENLRVIVCGGDGTVGWVLSEIDNVRWGRGGRPLVAIIPLGTGNDLSRSLYWGGRYKDKPIKKVLHEVEVAGVEHLDRWRLSLTPIHSESAERKLGAMDDIPEQIKVFNNYFSLGIDAHIALQFHNARNANKDKFTSRTRNLLFYGLEGGKDLVVAKWRHLMDSVTVVCITKEGDRIDVTERLKERGAHALLFLNIRSFSGGTRPWKREAGNASPNDGLLEVIAMDNLDLALLQIGGTGEAICQATSVEVTTLRAVPMQVDGEPLLINPCSLNINFHNQANMLTKKKTSYPYRDPEVEEWAARKIQHSFKTYRSQKSGSGDAGIRARPGS